MRPEPPRGGRRFVLNRTATTINAPITMSTHETIPNILNLLSVFLMEELIQSSESPILPTLGIEMESELTLSSLETSLLKLESDDTSDESD